eukprot:778178_1
MAELLLENYDEEKDDEIKTSKPGADRYTSEWDILEVIKKDLKLHVATSVMHSCTSKDQEAFMKQVEHCAIHKHDLDIFQVLSFESTQYDPLTIEEAWRYRTKSFKAVICSLTQIVAIIIILYQLVIDAQ